MRLYWEHTTAPNREVYPGRVWQYSNGYNGGCLVASAFFATFRKDKPPLAAQWKVSVFSDVCKAFNVFNTSFANMLKVLICLRVSNIMLTFRLSS